MATTTLSMVSYEEPAFVGSTTRPFFKTDELRQRRRHSSYHTRPWSAEHDNVQMLLDQFLTELSRRLDFLESYGRLELDVGIDRAYSTLCVVRDSCSHVSDEVIGAGRRRAKVLVEILEERYKSALARKDTLEQKVREGVRLMESILSDFEAHAYAIKDTGLGSMAEDFYLEGRRRVDAGLERAKGVAHEGLDKARRARATVKESVQRAVEKAREHGLITYGDLPDPWRINPHITSGYRFSETKVECLRSMFTISNELVNIWSHAIGLMVVLAIAFYFYPTSVNFSSSTNTDVFIAAVFFFAACKCLVCSTMWHTFNSIAEQTIMERFACVDYTGISLLVAASIMTTEYTAFYCEPMSRWIYLLTTAALGVGGVALPWHPTFNRADMAWARVGFYMSLSATGALPVIQLGMTRGLAWAAYFYAPITKSALVYAVGAVMYASKAPERYFPGWFDYFGGSHNIWHLAVLGGILFHYHAMQDFFAQAFIRAQTHCPAH